jgi:hypothetical protein
MEGLAKKIDCTQDMNRKMTVLESLVDFIHIDPELPETDGRTFNGPGPVEIRPGMTRDGILQYLEGIRGTHPVADLAFYASRDLAGVSWKPFLKAALERNPVVIQMTKELSDDAVYRALHGLPNESIYDGTRVAQPDEVWNFQRGDGLECAVALAGVLRARHPDIPVGLSASGNAVTLSINDRQYRFESEKGLEQDISL